MSGEHLVPGGQFMQCSRSSSIMLHAQLPPSSSLSPAKRLPGRRRCAAGPLPPPRGPICGGSTFFSKLLQRRRRRNKAAEGGGAAWDLLLSGLPLSSDASSSASLCSSPPPVFHSSTLPKVSALSFLFRQVGGEEVNGAKKKMTKET